MKQEKSIKNSKAVIMRSKKESLEKRLATFAVRMQKIEEKMKRMKAVPSYMKC